MLEQISDRYLSLHNEGLDQNSILLLLQLEFGIVKVHQWAAQGITNSPEGPLSEVIRDKTKYTAPSLKEYL